MKFSIALGFLCCFIALPLSADHQVVNDDGRDVLLNDDGSWEYQSADRFATTADGKRVRLKEDGSWEYTGEKRLQGSKLVTDQRYVDQRSLQLALSEVVVETFRGKKTAAHKNSRKQTQMVFRLDIELEKNAKAGTRIPFDTTTVSVFDTDGREYPVLSVTPATVALEPGDEFTAVIRVDGSPHWWTTKSISLQLDKSILGSEKDLVLTKPMSGVKKRNVEGF